MFWGRELLARMIGQAGAGQRVEEAQIARPLRGEFTLSPALCFEVLFPQILAGWAMWNLARFIGRRLDLEPN
jgi:hypothetical protein